MSASSQAAPSPPEPSRKLSLDILRSQLPQALAALRARIYLRRVNFLGPRVRVWGKPFVRNHGFIAIGNRSRLICQPVPVELVAGPEGRLEIGESVFINYGSSIAALQLVRIGARCNIGSYVFIMDNSFHRLEPERRLELPPSEPVIIEENVWLGSRVTVLSGVTIGADSVVGTGSIVARNIPPRSLAVGIPAKVIRSL